MRMNAILKSKLREFAREIHVLIDKVGNDDDKAVKALIQEQACSLTHQPKIIRNQGSDQEGLGPPQYSDHFYKRFFLAARDPQDKSRYDVLPPLRLPQRISRFSVILEAMLNGFLVK